MISGRLSDVQARLPARQAVRRWLLEAHGHGSQEAYGRWLADRPREESPWYRLPNDAIKIAQATGRGSRDAGADAYFLVRLVVVLNERVGELLEPAFLQLEGLEVQLRLLGPSRLLGAPGRSELDLPSMWLDWCASVSALAVLLSVADAAIGDLGWRYLGMSVLFPEAETTWGDLLSRLDSVIAAATASPSGSPRGLAILRPAAIAAAVEAHEAVAAAELIDRALWWTFRWLGNKVAVEEVLARHRSGAGNIYDDVVIDD